jgi:hypothetical protein
MAEVIKAGGHPATLCGPKDDEYCPHHEESGGDLCGYRRQYIEAASGKIQNWIFPHANLVRRVPGPFKESKFDATIIDESPWLSMVHADRLYADYLLSDWTTGVSSHDDSYPLRKFVNGFCRRVNNAMTLAGVGRLRKSHFKVSESQLLLTACDFRNASSLVLNFMIDLDGLIEPGMSKSSAAKTLKQAKKINIKAIKTAKALELASLTLFGHIEKSPYLRTAKESVDAYDGTIDALVLNMRWRENIHNDWLSLPVLYLDATMRPEIARQWLPNLDVWVPAETALVPEGVHVRQVTDRAVSYGMIRPDPRGNQNAQTTQRNNCARIARHIEVKACQFKGAGGAGVDTASIMPKATETEIARHFAPTAANALGHFSNVRGIDGWNGVGRLAIYGRPQVSPQEVEDLAWVIHGKVGQSLGDNNYPERQVGRLMADGSGRFAMQVFHPDPQAEAVRWLLTEGELMQDIARARHAWRDQRHPLHIDIGTNVPLPIPVNELVTWDEMMEEASPLAVMAARGVIPADWKGQAMVLADWFETDEAVRQWHVHRPDAVRAANTVQTLIGNSLLAFERYSFRRYRYRRVGDRNGSKVLIRSDLSDPRAVAERYLGPLNRWDERGDGHSLSKPKDDG